MRDFDHVADAQTVALCGMTNGVQLADTRDALALAESEITRLHSIIGRMSSRISALLTAHKSEPEAATGAIPEPAATRVRPVPATAPACAFPESALRHGWASCRPTTDRG